MIIKQPHRTLFDFAEICVAPSRPGGGFGLTASAARRRLAQPFDCKWSRCAQPFTMQIIRLQVPFLSRVVDAIHLVVVV